MLSSLDPARRPPGGNSLARDEADLSGPTPRSASRQLWRHRDFRRLWIGDSISQAGSQVSLLALPLIAVLYLHASVFEVGLLTAVESAAFLLVGLPAGAWCDRLRRRPVMIAGNLTRAALLASLPITAACGALTLAQLLAVALLHGVGTVFFDVAYQSYLPSLIERDQLVDGNARLQASQSVAQTLGPTMSGLLIQALTAPYAVAVDAASFVLSTFCILGIRRPEPVPPRPPQRRLGREIWIGMRFVLRHPILRMIAATTGTANLFNAVFGAVAVVFLVRSMQLGPGAVGALMSAGGFGGVLGAFTAARLSRRVGQARVIWLSLVATTPFCLLIPLTQRGAGLILFALGLFFYAFGVVIYNIAQVSFRQTLCPPELLGRMNATMRFLVWGTMPIGGLLGGVLGSWLGLRYTLWVSQLGIISAVGWVLASPLRRMRDLPYEADPAS